jgi:hypothetical protein
MLSVAVYSREQSQMPIFMSRRTRSRRGVYVLVIALTVLAAIALRLV